MKKVFVILTLVCSLLFSACGGDRDLYLPEAEGDAVYETVGDFGGV